MPRAVTVPPRSARTASAVLAVTALAAAVVAATAMIASDHRAPGDPARHVAPRAAAPSAAGLPFAEPGPWPAGWRRVEVAPSVGTPFWALVTYPAESAGDGADLDGAGGPYPAIAFGHGFFQEPVRYAGLLAHLATWGFVVIATESQGGLAPDHARFAADLSDTLTYLERAQADEGSWLRGAVRLDRFGASGHSMGGGASLLATAADRRIRAVANLAAAETRPSALAAMSQVAVPLHLIVGSEDAIVAPASTQRLYEAARPPRLFTTIVGGHHCGFQNDPFPIGCDRGSLPAAEQMALTKHLLTAFFRLYLTDDGDWDAVWSGPPDGDERLRQTADPGPRPTGTPRGAVWLPWLANGAPAAASSARPAR